MPDDVPTAEESLPLPRPRRGIVEDVDPVPDHDEDHAHPASEQPEAATADDEGGATESIEGASPTAPARPGLRQALKALVLPGRGQLVLALILCLTAALVVVTLRSQAARPDYSNLRRADLIQLLDNLTAETRRLEAEISDLQRTRNDLASGAEGAEAAKAEAGRRLAQLQIIGGTVAAHGKGIRISIADPEHKLTPELLLDALEELRDAGAEVIEFNDTVRVVASTWLGIDEQGRIVADGQVLALPIVIDAIGDPATLEAGARFRGGLVSEVEGARVGGTVTIEQLPRVDIASVVVPKPNEFARPN